MQFLTTKELADLLRIGERKVYDLAASGELPCTKATGKLLFPKTEIEAWLARNTSLPQTGGTNRPPVMLGSHDPLLEWAVRESGCGLATMFDASRSGLERFTRGEGQVAGLHLPNVDAAGWNSDAVARECGSQNVVLIHWAKRMRGLALSAAAAKSVKSLSDLRGLKFVPRQAGAGSQALFEKLLAEQGNSLSDISLTAPASSETDVAQAISNGKGDAGFVLQSVAQDYKLPFVPIALESYDLVVDRMAWFEPPMQRLISFARNATFIQRAKDYAGYDISEFGVVRFNAK